MSWIDDRNEERISKLHPTVAAAARQVVQGASELGITILVVQGLRTFDEQTALYNQGRFGNPGPIVTQAKAGYSYHNYGLAFDFCLIDGDQQISWEERADYNGDGEADWMQVVAVAKNLGFDWGGDWSSFKDTPHFEMTFGLSIQDLLSGKRPVAATQKEVTQVGVTTAPCTVIVDGTSIAGIVLDGRSYVTVRDFGDKLGYSINWDGNSSTAYVSKVLKLGSKGNDVKVLQLALNALGNKLTVDGDFGASTDAAVRAFQTSKGLSVDGEAGPITRLTILNVI